MRDTTCEKENRILSAVRSGEWTTELRAHVLECPVCSDLALVDDFLQNEATLTMANASLPDPSLVWSKGRLARTNRALGLVARPVQAVQVFAYLSSVIALIWLTMTYSQARPWMIEFSTRMQHTVETANPSVIAGLVGCLLFMFLGSAYLAWNEN